MRIQGQAYPEFAPVLQALFTALSGSQGNQILQGRSGVVQPQENTIETGLVHALSCIQARPNFREIVSTTNESGQSLAHLAILYDYPSLLRHLVDWGIDLALSDVNGLTALHFAYMKGDRHDVRVLQRGDAPETAKDKLGRIPSDLQPEEFDGGCESDVEMHPSENDIDEQVGLSALALHEYNTSEHGQSESEDDAPDAKKPASIAVDSFVDGDEGAGGSGRYRMPPGFTESVIERFPRILPSPPSNISNNNVSEILCQAALGGGDPIITTTGASLPRPANKQEDLSIGVDGLGSRRSGSIEAGTTNELTKRTNRDTSPDMEHHDQDEDDPVDGDDDLANHAKADPDKPDKPANNDFANRLHTMISDPKAASSIWWTELGTR